MQAFTLTTILLAAAFANAEWLIQGYSGVQCTGERLWDRLHSAAVNRICDQIPPNVASLQIVNNGPATWLFATHSGGGCLNEEFPGIPGESSVSCWSDAGNTRHY